MELARANKQKRSDFDLQNDLWNEMAEGKRSRCYVAFNTDNNSDWKLRNSAVILESYNKREYLQISEFFFSNHAPDSASSHHWSALGFLRPSTTQSFLLNLHSTKINLLTLFIMHAFIGFLVI